MGRGLLPDQSPELLSQSGGSTVTREASLDSGEAQPPLSPSDCVRTLAG